MRLLFDQNLSLRLVRALADLYPGSAHVRHLGLVSSGDLDVWQQAREEGFVIVSKDRDFHQRSLLLGHPPKVIWIRLGNCRTSDVVQPLRSRHLDVMTFEADDRASFPEIG